MTFVERVNPRLLLAAQWAVWAIPLACAVSRFAADMLLSFTALAFLIHAVITRRTDWLKPRWMQVALLLWVYAVLLSFDAENMEKAFGRSLAWIRFPLFAAALSSWLLQAGRDYHRLILSLSVAVGFMLVDTAIQYFIGYDIMLNPSLPAEGSPRLTGPFTSPRVGIMLVWMAVPVVAYWLMRPHTHATVKRDVWLGSMCAVGFMTVVFMSGERMALMLTGLGFLLAFFLLPISKRRMILLGLISFFIMAVLAHFNPGLIERQLGSTEEVVDDFGGSDYGQIWQSAWEVSKANPVFGVGLRQFREVCPHPEYGPTDPVTVKSRCNQHPHNIYLEWLVESGIVGLCLFLGMLALIWREVIRHFQSLRHNPVFLGLVITLFIRLWPLASNTSFFTAWSAVPMWLVIGWTLALCYRGRDGV